MRVQTTWGTDVVFFGHFEITYQNRLVNLVSVIKFFLGEVHFLLVELHEYQKEGLTHSSPQ